MSKLNIEKIIRTYFHSHLSESTRRKFAWWMVNSSDEELGAYIIGYIFERVCWTKGPIRKMVEEDK